MMVQEKGIIPDPLTEEQLRKLVLDAIHASTYAETLESFHALYGHPEFNEQQWQWKYYIATETVDGDAITIIIAIDTWRRQFLVITRWRAK